MSIDPTSEVITMRIPDACRMTDIGRLKLYELIATGEVEIVKISAMTLIPVDSLKALIDNGPRQVRSGDI